MLRPVSVISFAGGIGSQPSKFGGKIMRFAISTISVLLICAAASVLAQEESGTVHVFQNGTGRKVVFARHMDGLAILGRKDVQSDLRLTSEQKAKIEALRSHSELEG